MDLEVFNFKLTPAYCIYNGVAVVSQKGSEIEFMVEKRDEQLQLRLRKAFFNYLKYIQRLENCPEYFRQIPEIRFTKGNRFQIKKLVSESFINQDKPKLEKSEKENNEKNPYAAAVILLDTILTEARNMGATDIHIEDNKVKFRILGKLQQRMFLEFDKTYELIQRIKYLAGMNVLEKKQNQDGRFIYGDVNPLYLRVSVMNVVTKKQGDTGESVVIRLLDTKRNPLELDKLGFSEIQLEKIKSLSTCKSGLILVCGPTGAGKSTTAAAILISLGKNKKGCMKIISMEDPPEYFIPGVTQINVDSHKPEGFSDALSHVFRQDPDVLMIGEIRDERTAAVACRAALTGHLVIATLHTSSSAEAVIRLNDLGISNRMITAILRGVIVQEMKFIDKRITLEAEVSIAEKNELNSQRIVPLIASGHFSGKYMEA